MPSSSATLPPSLTMEQVKELFANWRQTLPKSNRIPAPLWEAVRHLIKEQGYTLGQINTQLRISRKQLLLNIDPQPIQSKAPSVTSHFVKVEPHPLPLFPSQPPSLEKPDYQQFSARVRSLLGIGGVLRET